MLLLLDLVTSSIAGEFELDAFPLPTLLFLQLKPEVGCFLFGCCLWSVGLFDVNRVDNVNLTDTRDNKQFFNEDFVLAAEQRCLRVKTRLRVKVFYRHVD